MFIIFPKLETRFNTHYQNVYANAFRNEFLELLRLSSNSNREYEPRGRPCQLRSCIVQFYPLSRYHVGRAPLRRSVGDIKSFQNDFAFIISTETCFWLKRVTDRSFFGVSERLSKPLIKAALGLSFAKITLKVIWKP